MSDKKPQPLIYRVIKAPASALLCTKTDKMVLLSYVDALNPSRNGTLAWPGLECIAMQWEIDEKTVRRAISRLCDLHLIKLQQRTGRGKIYTVNVGLIHRLIEESGHKVHSEVSDRAESPVRVGTVSGQSGHGAHLTAKEQQRKRQIPTFGCSSASKVVDDPRQRQLAVHGVVAGAAERMRVDSPEQPTIKKSDDLPAPKTARDTDP